MTPRPTSSSAPKTSPTSSTTSSPPEPSGPSPYRTRQAAPGPAARHKEAIVAERGYKNIATVGEDITEFSYRPRNCDHDYRVVALRKDLRVTGQGVLFNQFRYFFYITNDRQLSADEVVAEARAAATRRTSSPSSKPSGPCTPRSTPSTPTGRT